MIVRDENDGLLLISQADHARLAGTFAANWGNERFTRPAPFESMRLATARHDDGWIPWDAAPKIDRETRRPTNFPHIAVDEHIALYARGIQDATADDAYAGLMVNRHCQWLYDLKTRGSRTRPLWANDVSADSRDLLTGALVGLRRQHDQLVARLNAGGTDAALLTEQHLNTNSLLIQCYDTLSLYFCTGPLREHVLHDVPCSYAGETISIALHPIDDHTASLDPWPFIGPSLDLAVPARRLASKTFASDADLRDALHHADEVRLSFALVPPA